MLPDWILASIWRGLVPSPRLVSLLFQGGRSSAYISTLFTLLLSVHTLFVLSSAIFVDGSVVVSIRLVLGIEVSPAVLLCDR